MLRPGVILVQIDGLSREVLEKAIASGRMPLAGRLQSHEGYRLHSLYSGLPSSTASFEEQLLHSDDLLDGGTSYGSIAEGSVAAAHFCGANTGWGDNVGSANRLSLAGVLSWHGFGLAKTAGASLSELAKLSQLALRRHPERASLSAELALAPSRVAASVLLRELSTIGATIDSTRGVPVIYVNLFGYDEQAHRTGPTSAAAMRQLRGIDRAIGRLWRAVRRSGHREYDIWLVSGHGQQQVKPYAESHSQSLVESVANVLDEPVEDISLVASDDGRSETKARARWLFGRDASSHQAEPKQTVPQDSVVANRDALPQSGTRIVVSGALAHVHPRRSIPPEDRGRLAQALVEQHELPVVYTRERDGTVVAFTRQGRYCLPEQSAAVLGSDHPLAAVVTNDLVDICGAEDAGDLVLGGFAAEQPAVSFSHEYGSHGGPGPQETHGFALLPADAPVPRREESWLRPDCVRAAAQKLLSRDTLPAIPREPPTESRERSHLRLMTYNVHFCIGMDGKLSTSRIARVIAQANVDVVGLQEIDVRRLRSGQIDQVHEIATALEMEFHFHPSWQVEEEGFGDAILSRVPMRHVRGGPLPGLPARYRMSPRGVQWVELDVGGAPVQLMHTHLGVLANERVMQVKELLSERWLAHPEFAEPAILFGDFNSIPRSKSYTMLASQLRDAQQQLDHHRPRSTFISYAPVNRIDHVFLTEKIQVEHIEVPTSRLAKVASDHLPLIAELSIEPSPARSSANFARK